jgi:hypothetical protein
MATLTLAKANRLQDRIRAAVRSLPLKAFVTINIFAPEPEASVERAAARLREDVNALERLLAILASVRAATGRANTGCGINELLAERAAFAEEISLLSRLVPAQAALAGPADLRGAFDAANGPLLRGHPGEVADQVAAMRVRYEHAEGGETTLDASLLDDAEANRLSARIVARRRHLEEIGDQLRELNGSVLIELDDASLAYLRGQGVI